MTWLIAVLGSVALLAAGFAWLAFHRVRGQYFESNGVRLHFTDEGQGEPVILIHGLAANADLNWRIPRVVARLRRHFRVISLDARGHGLSAMPMEPRYYGTEMVEDVVRLMDHLGLPKAHVIGYSMGGFITLKLAMTHPERLLSASPCASGWGTFEGENAALFEALYTSILERGSFEPLTRKLEVGSNPPRWKIRLVDGAVGLVNNMPALGNLIHAFPEFEIPQEQLTRNEVPILSIVGTRDPLKENVALMRGILANHEIIEIRGTDHLTTVFHPRFIRGLEQFLMRHGASPRTVEVS